MADAATQRPQFTDADLEHEWVQRWRIPLVTNPYPAWKYEVALVVPDPLNTLNTWKALWPSDEEAEVVASYIDYRRSWYNEAWQRKMLERALDVDSGTNTVILVKAEAGWRYRRSSFDHGPWPGYGNDEQQAKFPPTKAGLVALLTHLHDHGGHIYEKFAEWMSGHPEVWE